MQTSTFCMLQPSLWSSGASRLLFLPSLPKPATQLNINTRNGTQLGRELVYARPSPTALTSLYWSRDHMTLRNGAPSSAEANRHGCRMPGRVWKVAQAAPPYIHLKRRPPLQPECSRSLLSGLGHLAAFPTILLCHRRRLGLSSFGAGAATGKLHVAISLQIRVFWYMREAAGKYQI